MENTIVHYSIVYCQFLLTGTPSSQDDQSPLDRYNVIPRLQLSISIGRKDRLYLGSTAFLNPISYSHSYAWLLYLSGPMLNDKYKNTHIQPIF